MTITGWPAIVRALGPLGGQPVDPVVLWTPEDFRGAATELVELAEAWRKYRAVGNGVPLQLGRVIARAVAAWALTDRAVRVCLCNCGRPVTGRQRLATAACRKRMERRRRRDTAAVTELGPVTAWQVTVSPVSESALRSSAPELALGAGGGLPGFDCEY
jgi:hypothetical protein